jgi:hypothetical protein
VKQPAAASTPAVATKLANEWRLDKYMDEDPTLAADSDLRVATQKAVKAYVDAILIETQLPVGSGYLSFTSTNPGTTLGYGTWAQVAQGRALFGVDPGDALFDAAAKTGGAKTKAISAHGGTAVADHADHTHIFIQSGNDNIPDLLAPDVTATGVAASGTTNGASVTLAHTVTQPNNHTDLNVLPPFFAIYVWQRTA